MFKSKKGPILILFSIVLLYCLNSGSFSRADEVPSLNISKSVSDESVILLSRAYWEQTDPSTARIRILAFSQCNVSDAVHLKIEDAKIKSVTRSVEEECPWHWSPGCDWNSFLIDSTIDLGSLETDEITVINKDDQVQLPLVKAPKRQDGLAVCVPPLYWYADWLRLAFFIETWRANGADHFHFYIQSVSKSVKSVLDAYVQEGIVTVIDWPLLPKSEDEDPNKSIYRLGHTLSHNDCRMRVGKKFVALVDVDEFVLPLKPNITLLEYLVEKLKSHPLAGSFVFKHTKLHFPDWPKNNDWSKLEWIGNVSASPSTNGPKKSIFIADRADIVLTHKIRSHFGIFSQVEVPEDEASLFHSRLNWIKNSEANDSNHLNFFVENKEEIAENLKLKLSIAEKDLPNGLNVNNTIVGNLISRCLAEWQSLGCKTPFNSCYESVSPVDEWIISESPSAYTVL
ncbi:hypothetical protein FO519_009292 [Halicephalobus sp. NKZ332]|nr:hypothetical protein FO519_009292 [Halicephalobus sp. NKZ332]